MAEKTKENELVVEEDFLPKELDTFPLQKETAEVVDKIIKSNDLEELKSLTDMFRLNIAKKNAVRVAQLQNLLDKVNEQAIDRFEKHPGEFSNKEVLDYMKAVQDQITASQNSITEIKDTPMIQVNNQKNEVNINVADSGLSRESKNRVLDAVKALLQQANNPAPIIENESEEETDE